MKIENGMLVLEKKNCRSCGYNAPERKGYSTRRIDCSECNGTGNGKRGGRNGCKKCHGSGNDYTWVNPVVCPTCNGDWEMSQDETYTDSINKQDVFDIIPVEVVRSNRAHSWIEHNIGVGLGSCTDYGEHVKQTDEELIAKQLEGNYNSKVQGCKIVRNKNDLRICDKICIVTSYNGYSVVAYFEDES